MNTGGSVNNNNNNENSHSTIITLVSLVSVTYMYMYIKQNNYDTWQQYGDIIADIIT